MTPTPTHPAPVDYLILGAGCAGLSTALALVEHGVTDTIRVVDARTRYDDDRTWCFWAVEPTRFTHLAAASWRTSSVNADGRVATASSDRFPYVRLSAAAFYEHALLSLARYPNVTVALGERMLSRRTVDGVAEVRTTAAVHRARCVIDARGLTREAAAEARNDGRAIWIPQHFLGQRIRTSTPTFSPGTCVLMDFDVDQSDGLRFVYVLPTSSTEALVENVYMVDTVVGPERHRDEIRRYLERVHSLAADDYRIEGEEAGTIPMTDHRFASRRDGSHAVGTLGGAVRPSSGYAFLRIQRSAQQLAAALAQERGSAGSRWRGRRGSASARWSARRSAVLDAVFLRFLADHASEAPAVFQRMFARTDSEALIRFLSDRSSVLDELRLVVALPKRRFVLVAFRALGSRLRAST